MASTSSTSQSDFSASYPLHYLVWNNEDSLLAEYCANLKSTLDSTAYNVALELKDNKGRTPLHLSIALGHYESMCVLLSAGADINIVNANKWSALHEAIGTGDPEIVSKALQYRQYQRTLGELNSHKAAYTDFIRSADFYLELKYEVTSWIPLVSTLFAPNDTLKIWKRKNRIRIDNTLVGFESLRWIRGQRSTILDVASTKHLSITMIDHDNRVATKVQADSLDASDSERLKAQSHMFRFSKDHVAKRLTEPTCDSYIEFDGVDVTQKMVKPGRIFNRGAEEGPKIDKISGYRARHYEINNVQVVTRKRTEHLANGDETKQKESVVETIFNKIKSTAETPAGADQPVFNTSNPRNLSAVDYFSLKSDSVEDVGRPAVVSSKTHAVNLNMWMVDAAEFPLDLKSQVKPIIDIAAVSNPQMGRLKQFLDQTLPEGVPIKTEIPLFNLITARASIEKVRVQGEGGEDVFPEGCFDVPAGYEKEDGFFADERRREGQGTYTQPIYDGTPEDYDVELEQAIRASIAAQRNQAITAARQNGNRQTGNDTDDEELQRVIQMSLYEQ